MHVESRRLVEKELQSLRRRVAELTQPHAQRAQVSREPQQDRDSLLSLGESIERKRAETSLREAQQELVKDIVAGKQKAA